MWLGVVVVVLKEKCDIENSFVRHMPRDTRRNIKTAFSTDNELLFEVLENWMGFT